MFQTVRLVSSLLLGIAFLMLGVGALSTLLAFRMGSAGYGPGVVGAVMSGYFVGIVVGTSFCHRLIVNVGHIRTFAALGSLASAATLAHAIVLDPWLWGALRFVVGFCCVGMYMCTESWLNEKSDNSVRGQVFSLYQIVLYLCQGLGQFLLNVPDESGLLLFVVNSILMSLAVIPVAITRVSAPSLPEPVRFRFAVLWRTSPTGMTGSFACGLIMGSVYGLGPLYAQRIGFDAQRTAEFMGALIIGGLLLQWPIGKISDRIDRRVVIAGVTAASVAVSLAIVGRDSGSGLVLLALTALFGGLSFTLYPLSVAYTNDHLAPSELVAASGGLIMAYGVGASLGPASASVAMNVFGAGGLFAYNAAVSGLMLLFVLWRMRARASVPMAEQGAFTPMPLTSPVVSELDPRAES